MCKANNLETQKFKNVFYIGNKKHKKINFELFDMLKLKGLKMTDFVLEGK